MSELSKKVKRLPLVLRPDPRRVLLRRFSPSLIVKPGGGVGTGGLRLTSIFARLMMLNDAEVSHKLREVMREFGKRHKHLHDTLLTRFEEIQPYLPTGKELDESRRLLLGSYFLNEYSFESSALFNPSMVPAPNQEGLGEGELRFLMSLRATGEGHISSITFRSGIVTWEGDVRFEEISRNVHQAVPHPAQRYDKNIFRKKLIEMGRNHEAVMEFTHNLDEIFLMEDLVIKVRRARNAGNDPAQKLVAETALLLAQANYSVHFESCTDHSAKVVFPYSPTERNGIEDARFTRFVDDDGSVSYHATCTGYDGNVVIPQMLSTNEFCEFSMCTLNGAAVANKGMALFPRKLHGNYAMLGRQDSENIHLMYSPDLHFWQLSEVVVRPNEPWEFVQLGNCGAPIETEAGWLVLTHGVGPMRKYCIGAVLLDLDDPHKIVGRLTQPLLRPLTSEREGYVPNVVYSCGGLIHGENLILPYAVSDTASRIAVVKVADLLAAMT